MDLADLPLDDLDALAVWHYADDPEVLVSTRPDLNAGHGHNTPEEMDATRGPVDF